MADLTADKGETVTLTYQVYNLGDQSGDQTVTLSVDGTQVDSDSNVQVGSLARSTATLEWDTSNADKGDHTLEVGSDNDSETITVNVGDVPTSLTEVFSIDAGTVIEQRAGYVASADLVAYSTGNNEVEAVKPASPTSVEWTFSNPSDEVTPIGADQSTDNFIFQDEDGELYGVDTNGNEVWSVTQSFNSTYADAANGRVAAHPGTAGSGLDYLDASNGSQLDNSDDSTFTRYCSKLSNDGTRAVLFGDADLSSFDIDTGTDTLSQNFINNSVTDDEVGHKEAGVVGDEAIVPAENSDEIRVINLDSANQTDSTSVSDPVAIDQGPNEDYIAVACGDSGTGSSECIVRVFAFPELNEIASATVTTTQIEPGGVSMFDRGGTKHILVGADDGTVAMFEFA